MAWFSINTCDMPCLQIQWYQWWQTDLVLFVFLVGFTLPHSNQKNICQNLCDIAHACTTNIHNIQTVIIAVPSPQQCYLELGEFVPRPINRKLCHTGGVVEFKSYNERRKHFTNDWPTFNASQLWITCVCNLLDLWECHQMDKTA